MMTFPNTPYWLGTDANIEPSESAAIATAVSEGRIIDVFAERCDGKAPMTFYGNSFYRGMKRAGTSRLDLFLANPVAAASVRECTQKNTVRR